jgi:membrane associated rhomboid family serine protease
MVFTPVGIKCAEHAGVRTGVTKVAHKARRFSVEGTGMLLTKILIGINVAVYLLMVAQGASLSAPSGRIFIDYALFGPLVAQGEWWRLITAGFLHASIFHTA